MRFEIAAIRFCCNKHSIPLKTHSIPSPDTFARKKITSVAKTIEVDSRVPGIRHEVPFSRIRQCSPELDSPSCQFKCPFSQKFSVCRKNLSSHLSVEMQNPTQRPNLADFLPLSSNVVRAEVRDVDNLQSNL